MRQLKRAQGNDKTEQKQALSDLAVNLIAGNYGLAICNGWFKDYATGVFYYVLNILNVMPLTDPRDSLTGFIDREPNKIYTFIDHLW